MLAKGDERFWRYEQERNFELEEDDLNFLAENGAIYHCLKCDIPLLEKTHCSFHGTKHLIILKYAEKEEGKEGENPIPLKN